MNNFYRFFLIIILLVVGVVGVGCNNDNPITSSGSDFETNGKTPLPTSETEPPTIKVYTITPEVGTVPFQSTVKILAVHQRAVAVEYRFFTADSTYTGSFATSNDTKEIQLSFTKVGSYAVTFEAQAMFAGPNNSVRPGLTATRTKNVNAKASDVPTNPILALSATQLSVNKANNFVNQLTAINTGGGALSGTVSVDQPYLMVSPVQLTGNYTLITVKGDTSKVVPGTYTGKATINSNGGVQVVSVTFTKPAPVIKPNNPPSISLFDVNPKSGVAPLGVNYQTMATDPDGDSLTYTLYINEVAMYTTAAGFHTFNRVDSYDLRMEVSDGKGGKAERTVRVTVNNPVGDPMLDMSAQPPVITEGQSSNLVITTASLASLKLQPGNIMLPLNGTTYPVSPTSTTLYTVSGVGLNGVAMMDTVTVKVVPKVPGDGQKVVILTYGVAYGAYLAADDASHYMQQYTVQQFHPASGVYNVYLNVQYTSASNENFKFSCVDGNGNIVYSATILDKGTGNQEVLIATGVRFVNNAPYTFIWEVVSTNPANQSEVRWSDTTGMKTGE